MHVVVLHSLLQGVEVVDGKPIIYSGGSFVDDYAADRHYRNDLSAVFLADFVASEAPAAAGKEAAAAAAAEPAAAGADEGSDRQQGRDQSEDPERQQPVVRAADPGASQPAAAATAGSGGGQSQHAPGLVLQSLRALPIAITHSWRTEGGPFKEAGMGNPPYFSQVG
jgi:hypothetical protein